MPKKKLRIELHDETYAGEPTGRTVFHVHPCFFSGCMGRGYTVEQGLEDFIRRFNFEADRFHTKRDFEWRL